MHRVAPTGLGWIFSAEGVARRDFDIVAAWSVCRLGRSLSDLIGLRGELRSRDIDLLNISTQSGRTLFGILGLFSEFERSMIRCRVMDGRQTPITKSTLIPV